MKSTFAVVLGLFYSCAFDSQLPAEAVISCAQSVCPIGFRCQNENQICAKVGDFAGGTIVSLSVSPQVAKAGTLIQGTLVTSSSEIALPIVTLVSSQGEQVAVFEVVKNGSEFSISYVVPQDTQRRPPEGVFEMVVTLTDSGRRVATLSANTRVRFDYTAPRFEPTAFEFAWKNPSSLAALLGMPTALCAQSGAKMTLLADEAFSIVSVGAPSVQLSATNSSVQLMVVEANVMANVAVEAMVMTEVVVKDQAGNETQVRAPLRIDTQPPLPIASSNAGVLLLNRHPYGSQRIPTTGSTVSGPAAHCTVVLAQTNQGQELGSARVDAGTFQIDVETDVPQAQVVCLDALGNRSAGQPIIKTQVTFPSTSISGVKTEEFRTKTSVRFGTPVNIPMETKVQPSWILRGRVAPNRGGGTWWADSERANVFLFGGAQGNNYGRDFWKYADNEFRLLAGPTSSAIRPIERVWSTTSYDLDGQRLLLFGGRRSGVGTDHLSDTWVWSAATGWTQRFPEMIPEAREQAAMAYHRGLKSMVMFGGKNYPTHGFDELWLFDFEDAQWKKLEFTNGPVGRFGASMVPFENDVLLFGGATDDGGLDDTWRLLGDGGFQRLDAGPVFSPDTASVDPQSGTVWAASVSSNMVSVQTLSTTPGAKWTAPALLDLGPPTSVIEAQMVSAPWMNANLLMTVGSTTVTNVFAVPFDGGTPFKLISGNDSSVQPLNSWGGVGISAPDGGVYFASASENGYYHIWNGTKFTPTSNNAPRGAGVALKNGSLVFAGGAPFLGNGNFSPDASTLLSGSTAPLPEPSYLASLAISDSGTFLAGGLSLVDTINPFLPPNRRGKVWRQQLDGGWTSEWTASNTNVISAISVDNRVVVMANSSVGNVRRTGLYLRTDAGQWNAAALWNSNGPTAALTWNPQRQSAIVFGGYGSYQAATDRLLAVSLDGGVETLTPEDPENDGNPGPRAGHMMAYDISRKRVVMFGGLATENELWELREAEHEASHHFHIDVPRWIPPDVQNAKMKGDYLGTASPSGILVFEEWNAEAWRPIENVSLGATSNRRFEIPLTHLAELKSVRVKRIGPEVDGYPRVLKSQALEFTIEYDQVTP
jgi:hypothetical protein